jgi:hypothetical protein
MTGSQGQLQRLGETDQPDWPDVAALFNAIYAHAEHQTAQLAHVRKHLGQIDERLGALESGSAASSDALAELCADLLTEAGDEQSPAV